jgi:uncharacterized protein YcgI (DUF1989 family)
LLKGQILRLIDVEGEQVADLVSFALTDTSEYLSSGRSIDYNEKIFFTTGDVLYSNLSRPMLTITADQVGKHDFLFAPCSQEMFQITYDVTAAHPNCLDNLISNLKPYGVTTGQIHTAFNAFMNTVITSNGEVKIELPTSKAGDHIDFRAEMDLIVGLSACSAEKCNNYRCTSIDVEIHSELN